MDECLLLVRFFRGMEAPFRTFASADAAPGPHLNQTVVFQSWACAREPFDTAIHPVVDTSCDSAITRSGWLYSRSAIRVPSLEAGSNDENDWTGRRRAIGSLLGSSVVRVRWLVEPPEIPWVAAIPKMTRQILLETSSGTSPP
jgi:hypothetical protein